MSEENVVPRSQPPFVRALVWLLWVSPPVRALSIRWWPRGQIRRILVAGFFARMYDYINRYRTLPPRVLHPDFALRFPPDVELLAANARTMRGPDAVRTMFDKLEEGLSEIRWVPEQVIETPNGQFLAFVRMEAAGGGSQVPLREPVAIIATFRNGRASEGTMFVNRAEALEAAGLSD